MNDNLRTNRARMIVLRPCTLIASLGALLSGCAVGPDYQVPSSEVPDRFHQAALAGLARCEADVQAWWQVFEDDMLTSFIHRAAENNLNLRMAVLRIREARALRGIAAGELLPALSGRESYNRSKASANSPMGRAAVQPPGPGKQFANTVTRGMAGSVLSQQLGTAFPDTPRITNSVASGLMGLIPSRGELPRTDEQDLFVTGFDASWEIDVFGGIRRNVEAADAVLDATVEDYRNVLVSLLAETATTYVDIRALQARLDATVQNIELQTQTLSLTRTLFDLGLTSELDVHQAETNLARTESDLPILQTALAMSMYRMGVLLGQEPSAVWNELSPDQPIPEPPAETLVGVPVDILRRRPDIRAAERRLAVETARIGVATADIYPRFTLSGTFAFEAMDINHALDARSVSYGFGPAVRWNVFDGMRNLNRIAAQQAAAHQAYVAYEQTILLALEEVESSLVAYRREQARHAALSRAVEAARRSAKLAERNYRDGMTDFQRVLDAQRSLVLVEDALAQSRGQVVVYLVALYKALGGGWSPDVVHQAQYLADPPDALDDPLGFFISAGKDAQPWESQPDTRRNGKPDTDMQNSTPRPTNVRETGSSLE